MLKGLYSKYGDNFNWFILPFLYLRRYAIDPLAGVVLFIRYISFQICGDESNSLKFTFISYFFIIAQFATIIATSILPATSESKERFIKFFIDDLKR